MRCEFTLDWWLEIYSVGKRLIFFGIEKILTALFSINSIFEHLWFFSLFCAIFLRIWKQNLPLKWTISEVFLPDVCQMRSRHIGKFVHATDGEIIFKPNSRKLVVECDWNSEISQNVRNLGLFEKIDGFFWEKNLIFFQKR